MVKIQDAFHCCLAAWTLTMLCYRGLQTMYSLNNECAQLNRRSQSVLLYCKLCTISTTKMRKDIAGINHCFHWHSSSGSCCQYIFGLFHPWGALSISNQPSTYRVYDLSQHSPISPLDGFLRTYQIAVLAMVRNLNLDGAGSSLWRWSRSWSNPRYQKPVVSNRLIPKRNSWLRKRLESLKTHSKEKGSCLTYGQSVAFHSHNGTPELMIL